MYEINKSSLIFVLITFFLLSNFGSFFQAQFIYDSFHWGLVAQSAINLLKNDLLPYKDFFIHYGFLSTLIQSFILSVFEKDVIYLMYASSLFFSIGNLIICLTAKKYLSFFNIIFICFFIFFIHPFANYPWYNYQFYFLLTLSLFLLSNRSNLGIFFFSFILSLASLVYENFFYLSIFVLFLHILFNKFYKDKKFLICIFGFILPLFTFHIYLFIFSLHEYWLKTFTLNGVFLEIYNISFLNLIIEYFHILFSKNLFTQTYFYIFLFIFIFNLLISFYFVSKKFKKEFFSNKENDIFIISILSLLLFLTTIHNPTIFRFSTGPIIGIIPIIFFIEKFKIKYLKPISYLILLQLFCNIVLPIKTENNKFFPKFSDITENVRNQNISFFKSQKWRERTWSTLSFFDQKVMLIKKECKNINEFINYTDDGFIYMIANKYLISKQYLYWIKNERYFEVLLRHYDINIKDTIQEKLTDKSLIIFVERKDLFSLKKEYDFKNYNFIEAPYSFDNKRKGILIPDLCLED